MIGLNLFGNSFFGSHFSWIDLLGFTLFAVSFVMILSWYYGKIKSKNIDFTEKEISIYSSRDVLLQEKERGLELLPSEKTTSIWVKTIVFVLIFLVAVTPLYQLLGTEYFL